MKKIQRWATTFLCTFALTVAPIAPSTVTAIDLFSFGGNEDKLDAKDIEVIQEVYQAINESYLEDVDKEVLVEGALKGMVDALDDPYSEYFNVDESMQFDESMEDSFEGIGVEISAISGQITIVTPIDDTPADKAGLMANDIILKADDHELSDLPTHEVIQYIRGPKGEPVELTIQRGDATFTVTVERDTIPLHSVKSERDADDERIGYLRLSQFAVNTAEEVQTHIEDLRQQEVEAFVIDLRTNPGGFLDQALQVSNMFLDDGQVIMQTEAKGEEPFIYLANEAFGTFKVTEPIVVLIDEGSASASEILAATLNENLETPLVGQTTFGKGTVQAIDHESEYGELKLTVSRWLTADGNWIHDKGVAPTVEVEAEPVATAVVLPSDETFALGDTDSMVESIYLKLQALEYPVDSDQVFDETMEDSVKQFQEDHDLEPTGQLTGETTTELLQAIRDYLDTHDRQYDEAIQVLQQELER